MKKFYHLIPLLFLLFSFSIKGNNHYDKTYLYLKHDGSSSFECRKKDPFWSKHLKVSSEDPIHPLVKQACNASSQEQMKEAIQNIIKHPESRRFVKLRVKSSWMTWRGLKALIPDHIIHYDSVTPEEMLEKLSN